MHPTPLLPLDPALDGARIQGVQQPDAASVLLETHRAGVGAARWRFEVGADTARWNRAFARDAAPAARRQGGPPSVFCQWLRTRLEGGRIVAVTLRHAQIVQLTVQRGDAEAYLLVLELNRRESNLLLLDGEGRLLIALRHPGLPGRKLGPGDGYRPPERIHAWPATGPLAVPLAERLPAPDEATARAREAAWRERTAALALEARRVPARQAVRRELKRLERRLAKQAQDRAAAAEAEPWRRRGELLQIHRAALRPGLSSIEVPDVFEPGAPMVTIALDPRAEPGEQIERCFRQYRRRRDAAPHAEQRMAETRGALERLGGVAAAIDAAGSAAALEALADTLPGTDAALRRLLRGVAVEGKPGQAGAADGEGGGPLRRLSADGLEIRVGRSKEENDRLTFRTARGRDWWLHAQGIPGSHVVVLNPGGDALPPRTLREAAWLAGYYSQARASGRVEVDYVQRKHVRKPKGGEAGQVTYSQNKSLLVDLEDAALREVLSRTLPGND